MRELLGTATGARGRVAQMTRGTNGRARHSVRAASSVWCWNSGPFLTWNGAHGVTRPTPGRLGQHALKMRHNSPGAPFMCKLALAP